MTRLGSLARDAVPPLEWRTVREFLMIGVGALLAVALYTVDGSIDSAREANRRDLQRNYEADLRDRAASCRIQLGLGIPLGANCLDPVLVDRGYFNPRERIQTGSLRALCALASQSPSITVPEGCPHADG